MVYLRRISRILNCGESVGLPEKFKHKICSLEDSKDFAEMSFQELANALQAVEKRQAYKLEGSNEEALVVAFNQKNQNRFTYKNNPVGVSRKDKGKYKFYNN